MKKKTTKKTSKFTVSVKVLNKLYKAEGKTFDEAVSKLQIRNAKGMSVWTVKHGKETREKIIMPALTQRIFTLKGLAYEIAFKNVKQLFA
jgi:hypothetical protein